MKHLLISAMMCAVGLSAMGQTVCLETDFTSGIPSGFTLVCNDEMPVKVQDFNNITPVQKWFAAKVYSADGSGVLSTSHRQYDLPTDNWLITPKMSLPEGVWLKWTAKAMHYHLRDGYKVMVSTTDNDIYSFEELYAVEAEEYLWTRHLVSLEKYAGKDVYIAFVHDSQNMFLLALDDLFVGQVSTTDFIVKNKTARFAGNVVDVPMEVSILNSGVELNSQSLELVTSLGDTIRGGSETDVTWKTGEMLGLRFNMPVAVGNVVRYKLESPVGVGEGRLTLLEDSIICSHYPRTLLLEKTTGNWCINCPDVISYIQEIEETYGEELVCIEAHGYYGDKLEYMPYVTGLKTMNFPTLFYNRNNKNAGTEKEADVLARSVVKPTIAKIGLTLSHAGENRVTASTTTEFATDTDNSSDKYRIGYAIIEKTVSSAGNQQIGGNSTISKGEFYYMKSPFAVEFMQYTNVVRGMESAFVGVKKSLPTSLEAGVAYSGEQVLEIPSTVADLKQVAIVAMVFNYYTEEVLNVVEVPLSEEIVASVAPTNRTEGSVADFRVWSDGTCRVACDEGATFTVEVITLDGTCAATISGKGSGEFDLSRVAPKGLYLVRLVTSDGILTKKVVMGD